MYEVELSPEAEEDLRRLASTVAQRVLNKIRWLAENLDQLNPEALTGNYRGMYKLWRGDYRVFYTFDRSEQRIMVHVVGHRKEVYRTR